MHDQPLEVLAWATPAGHAPLIENGLKPGDWTIARRGVSGQRYRLRFHGNTLEWLSRWDEGNSGTPYAYHYWRRVWYRRARNGKVPRSPQIQAAFADIGVTDIHAFVDGKHVRLSRVDE